jgi:hypothetical protein
MLGWFVAVLGAVLADGRPVPGADKQAAVGPQPERFQYFPDGVQDKLVDTATGRLYMYGKENEEWFLYAKEPKDLDAEAVKSPKPKRFQYLPRLPQDRLFDTATGRVYLLDRDGRKWFRYIKEPKP